MRHILDSENRRSFQSKKHVSLDIKHTKFLENILKGSSSEEEFDDNRKHYQSRKHQSLDPKVHFKLDKDQNASSSSDEDFDGTEIKSLIREKRHESNSIIIDLKDFQNILKEEAEEEEEEFVKSRELFQQQKSISTDSRRSHRFFEMDEMNRVRRKDDNLRSSVPFMRQITEDGKPMLEIYRPTTNPIYIYTQVSYVYILILCLLS